MFKSKMVKPLVEWHKIYSVNSEVIDSQHKMLIDLINQLHQGITRQMNDNIIKNMLSCLVDYSLVHFDFEERLMERHGFPKHETMEHKMEHENFKDFILAEQKKLESSNGTIIGEEVLDFLKDWVLNHILKVDKKLGDFLNQKRY